MTKNIPTWAWIVIGILAFTTIMLFISLLLFNSVSLEEAESNDEVKENNLLFTLDNAQIDTYPERLFTSEFLFLDFIVTNVGKNIENVSDCGILLFEDSSQYKLKVNTGYDDISGTCNYYDMVPGSKITITSIFTFIDGVPQDYITENWKENYISWEKVPGSKIIYFSQQNSGLINYTIDKSEIIHTN